jgi:nitroreductase
MVPYRVVLVDDPSARQRLSSAMLGPGNVARVRDAPLTAVFLADLHAGSRGVLDLMEREARAGKPAKYVRDLQVNVPAFAGGWAGCETPAGPVMALVSSARSAAVAAASRHTPLPQANTAEGWAFKNASLAAMAYMLAATSHGLATHPMEGFDARRVREAVGADDEGKGGGGGGVRWGVPMVVSTGYELAGAAAAAADAGSGRPGLEGVFMRNAFGRNV